LRWWIEMDAMARASAAYARRPVRPAAVYSLPIGREIASKLPTGQVAGGCLDARGFASPETNADDSEKNGVRRDGPESDQPEDDP